MPASSEDDDSQASGKLELEDAIRIGFWDGGDALFQRGNDSCCALLDDHCMLQQMAPSPPVALSIRCIDCGYHPHARCYKKIPAIKNSKLIPKASGSFATAEGFCMECLSKYQETSLPEGSTEPLLEAAVVSMLKSKLNKKNCMLPVLVVPAHRFDEAVKEHLSHKEKNKDDEEYNDDDKKELEMEEDDCEEEGSKEEEEYVPEDEEEEDEDFDTDINCASDDEVEVTKKPRYVKFKMPLFHPP
jgi:hypothetical protein